MAGSALGDTNRSTYGTVGIHSLLDTKAKPGATCDSNPDVFEAIVVRPPRMWAASTATKPQLVSWRVALRSRLSDGHLWWTGENSAWQYGYATTLKKAPFVAIRMVPRPVVTARDWDYQVFVEMRWHGASKTKVLGRSRHQVDWYGQNGFEPQPPVGPKGYCYVFAP